MPQQITTSNYLTFTIPKITDPVDIPKAFTDYANSLMSGEIGVGDSAPTEINITHINTILVYDAAADVTIKTGLPKGFQFSIVSNGGDVNVTCAADLILPVNPIGAGKVATFTKIKEGVESLWLMAVGG